jgi:serine/threonine protein kinase
VGTLQYMAPEQLQGKDADPRSDLFSFGCVLYEILSGKAAFDGAVPASVIGAILEREPEPLEVARPLNRVIRRSLAKDPDQRFQTARDLKVALNWATEASPAAPADPGSQLSNKLPRPVAGVSILALIIAGVLLNNAARPSPSRPLIHLDAEIASNAPMATSGNMLAL